MVARARPHHASRKKQSAGDNAERARQISEVNGASGHGRSLTETQSAALIDKLNVTIACDDGNGVAPVAPTVAGWKRSMNIHHLELFYYVAKHGGISRAVRNMPYGIQQPAVSSQILLLEEDLGLKLFERTPFKLTREGEELFSFAQPFFENLEPVAARLRQKSSPHLRIAASELVLRDYLPVVVERMRKQEPRLKLALRSGFQADMEKWLLEREVDLAITPLDNKPPGRIRCLRLMRLPLVLLVHKKSKIRSAAELWSRGQIEEPLICLPQTEAMSRIFRKGLQNKRVDWPQSIEASSMDLVTRYVANGYGIGLSVNAAEVVRHPSVRVLPLDDFDSLEIAALWTGEASSLVQAVLKESQRYVAERWPDWVVGEKLN
jgi:DNA-binding transcriptional LysR family regulator